MQKEGAICGALRREREELAGSAERGNHLQGKEPLAEKGAIFSSHCREREQFAGKEGEGTLCKERNH